MSIKSLKNCESNYQFRLNFHLRCIWQFFFGHFYYHTIDEICQIYELSEYSHTISV